MSGCGQAHAFQLTYTAPRILLTLEQRVRVCVCVGVPGLAERNRQVILGFLESLHGGQCYLVLKEDLGG